MAGSGWGRPKAHVVFGGVSAAALLLQLLASDVMQQPCDRVTLFCRLGWVVVHQKALVVLHRLLQQSLLASWSLLSRPSQLMVGTSQPAGFGGESCSCSASRREGEYMAVAPAAVAFVGVWFSGTAAKVFDGVSLQ